MGDDCEHADIQKTGTRCDGGLELGVCLACGDGLERRRNESGFDAELWGVAGSDGWSPWSLWHGDDGP